MGLPASWFSFLVSSYYVYVCHSAVGSHNKCQTINLSSKLQETQHTTLTKDRSCETIKGVIFQTMPHHPPKTRLLSTMVLDNLDGKTRNGQSPCVLYG